MSGNVDDIGIQWSLVIVSLITISCIFSKILMIIHSLTVNIMSCKYNVYSRFWHNMYDFFCNSLYLIFTSQIYSIGTNCFVLSHSYKSRILSSFFWCYIEIYDIYSGTDYHCSFCIFCGEQNIKLNGIGPCNMCNGNLMYYTFLIYRSQI